MCAEAGIAASSAPLVCTHSSSKHSLKVLLFKRVESLQKEILIPALQLKECLLKRISKALHHTASGSPQPLKCYYFPEKSTINKVAMMKGDEI